MVRQFYNDQYDVMLDVHGIRFSAELFQDLKCIMGHDPFELLVSSMIREGKFEDKLYLPIEWIDDFYLAYYGEINDQRDHV